MSEPLKCKGCGAPLVVKGQHLNIVRCDYCGTDNVLTGEARTVVADDSLQFAVKLYKAIANNFDLDGIRDLVESLKDKLSAPHRLDYENLPGSRNLDKARELVQWCQRRRLLQPLVDTVLSVQPSIDLS